CPLRCVRGSDRRDKSTRNVRGRHFQKVAASLQTCRHFHWNGFVVSRSRWPGATQSPGSRHSRCVSGAIAHEFLSGAVPLYWITWLRTPDRLVTKFASPTYLAVIWWGPRARVEILKVALPLTTLTLPMTVVPS